MPGVAWMYHSAVDAGPTGACAVGAVGRTGDGCTASPAGDEHIRTGHKPQGLSKHPMGSPLQIAARLAVPQSAESPPGPPARICLVGDRAPIGNGAFAAAACPRRVSRRHRPPTSKALIFDEAQSSSFAAVALDNRQRTAAIAAALMRRTGTGLLRVPEEGVSPGRHVARVKAFFTSGFGDGSNE